MIRFLSDLFTPPEIEDYIESPTFSPWPKTPRLHKDIVVSEKIDGTNAAVYIEEHPAYDEQDPSDLIEVVRFDDEVEFHIFAQSRKRFITPESDNHGFADYVLNNAETLVQDLGKGRHFGEWWGKGIQRGYGMVGNAFSLFNTKKWEDVLFATPALDVVPVLFEGPFDLEAIEWSLDSLREFGSYAPKPYDVEFFDPEGVCVFHTAANMIFKVPFDDE